MFMSLYPIRIRKGQQGALTNLNEIHFSELREGWGAENVEDGDDVLMIEMAEEFDLAESAEAEHAMVEGSDALDCDFALGGDVNGGAIGRYARDRTR